MGRTTIHYSAGNDVNSITLVLTFCIAHSKSAGVGTKTIINSGQICRSINFIFEEASVDYKTYDKGSGERLCK